MAFCNLNYQMLIFKDVPTNGKPNVRIPDITDTINQVPMNNVKTDDPTIQPGETRTIAVTLRTLATDATTEFSIERPIATQDLVRLRWDGTGTNPVFRTARAIATDATTQISFVRQGPNVVRIQSTGGTAMDTSTVQLGDTVQFGRNTDTFTSPFGAQNLGAEYVVQAKGAGYVDVIDNGNAGLDLGVPLGASFAIALRIFSASPVRIGDKVHIDGATVNANNAGDFAITDVSSDYLEFCNPFASPQVFVNTSTLVVVYDHLIEFLYIQTTGPITLTTNQTNSEDIVMFGNCKGIKIATTRAYQIDATNKGDSPVEVLIVHAGLN